MQSACRSEWVQPGETQRPPGQRNVGNGGPLDAEKPLPTDFSGG